MIISELRITNFRKFGGDVGTPGLKISFHKGLNALIGENDAGKTSIIDAIKMVLLTQSNEYIRATIDDFHINADKTQATEFKIDCTLSEFSENEAKNFIEYLTFYKTGDDVSYTLDLHYRAWIESNKVYSEVKVGSEDDSVIMDGKARELLKAVYLKPLRDAEHELRAGRNSRISQILFNHPLFKSKNDHQLIEIFKQVNNSIEKYFIEEDGKEILQTIRQKLQEFNGRDLSGDASLKAADIHLKSILESLSLTASEFNPGLGELNLLFIAAELILLKQENAGGIKLALIEELEAHLHPQAQLRLINYLQSEYSDTGTQIIISTHSPLLASKINLKNLILVKNGQGYDLADGQTLLEKGDYLFLQRFLDSTKANLFFAKGIIMVEGDAENILVPIIAEIIGYPLEKYGVSIVNVGSTAFLRYSRIMLRKKEGTIGIPVSVITDCDIRPWDIKKTQDGEDKRCFSEKKEESARVVMHKKEKYEQGSVHAYVSPMWTLEYCIAASCLSDEFQKAIQYGKKILNSDKYSLTDDKIKESDKEVDTQNELFKSLGFKEKALHICETMIDNEGNSSLKSIVAQCLASILKWQISIVPDDATMAKMFDLDLYRYRIDEAKRTELKNKIESDEFLKYIVDAIKYAVGV